MAVSAVVGLVTAAGGAIAAGGIPAMVFFGLKGATAFAAMFALGAGVSMLSKALIPKPDLGAQMRGVTVTTRDPAGPRKLVYGKVRTGGNVVFIDHSGDDNKYLHLVVVFASHEIQGYDEIWFNDNKIWTSTGGFQSDWGTYVTIDRKFGTASQAASTSLVSASSNWTTDHKLSGIAYIAFRLEWNRDKFPQGVPNISSVIRGKKVYDPRTEVFTYSQNPALCVRDYLLDSKYGLGEESANINYTALAAAANLCEEQVSLSGGGTQDRYQCNGVIDTSNQIRANIEQLLSSMGGRLTYSGGEYFIEGAEYRTPTVTIDESVIISPIKTQTKQSRRSIYNSVKGTFLSEEKNYKVLDYPAQTLKTLAGSFETDKKYRILFVGTTDFTAIGASSNAVGVEFTATGAGSGTGYASAAAAADGDLLYLDMPLPFVTNNFQAQRLAKIAARKSRQEIVVSMTVNLTGLKIKIGDTIYLDYDKLGYDGKVFEVIGYELVVNSSGEVGVRLECIETASEVYDWSSNDEEDFLSGGELDLYDGRTVENVTFTASDITEIGLLGPDGGVNSSVQLVWTAPDDAFIEFYKIRYNKNGTTDYFEAETRETRIILSGLDVNQRYDFRIQAQNLIGVSSTGTTVSNFLLEGDDTGPGLPTGLGTTGGLRAITVTWTNPSDIDLKQIEVHVVASNSTPADGATPEAVITGEEYVYPTGQAAAVTKYFFLRAVDFSGNKSAYTSGEAGTSLQVTSEDVGAGEIEARTIALLLNYYTDGVTPNSGEAALVGVNLDGTPNYDTDGFVLYDGEQITIEHDQYTNSTGSNTVITSFIGKNGFIAFDINKTQPFQMGSGGQGSFGDINCAFVWTEDDKWYYDTNDYISNATNLIAGVKYEILTVGTTDFTAIGASANTVGVTFTATAAGTGTGTAKRLTWPEFNPNSFTGTVSGAHYKTGASTTTAKLVALGQLRLDEVNADTIVAGGLYADPMDITATEIPDNVITGRTIVVESITANKISGDISEVFNLSKFVYPYHSVPALVADTFTEFVVPAPDIAITKYASLLGKIKYQASSNLDACLLVMEFQRKSAGTASGVSIGSIAGSGTTGQPYTHYVEVSGNHTKEIDVYGGIATSQTSPSFVASPSSVEFDGSTNRTRIIYGNPSPSTPTFTSGTLYYNEDRWLSSGTWLGDAAGAQRFPIPAIGTTAMQTLPLTQALAKSDSQEEYRIRVYSQSLSTGTLSLSAIDTQIILST